MTLKSGLASPWLAGQGGRRLQKICEIRMNLRQTDVVFKALPLITGKYRNFGCNRFYLSAKPALAAGNAALNEQVKKCYFPMTFR